MECDPRRRARVSIKAHALSNCKEKLRKNCLERAKEDRAHLIWKIRSSSQNPNQKEVLNSAFRSIISDELKKIEGSTSGGKEYSESSIDDSIWEYNNMQVDSYPGEYEREELLFDMERLLYEDLRKELIRRELDAYEEEDEYLAKAVFEQLNVCDDQTATIAAGDNRVMCPVCKQGELKEDLQQICCNYCDLHLDLESDKLNLDVLRCRLSEAYEEHLDRGCNATPTICMEARFKITALYIECPICHIFEIIV